MGNHVAQIGRALKSLLLVFYPFKFEIPFCIREIRVTSAGNKGSIPFMGNHDAQLARASLLLFSMHIKIMGTAKAGTTLFQVLI